METERNYMKRRYYCNPLRMEKRKITIDMGWSGEYCIGPDNTPVEK